MRKFLATEREAYRSLLKRTPPLMLTALVLSVVSMNLLANKELFRSDWIALDCGFLLSWAPFLIMDAVCKAYGGKDATRLSLLAIAVNLALFVIFKLVALTPGMWGAYYSTGSLDVNEALNDTIGGSTWIVLGSALAMAVASITNSIVNVTTARLVKRGGYASFAARSFISTMASQFVDNLVFALTVSVPLFGWSMRMVLFCSLSAAMFELLMEVAFSGIGYRLANRLDNTAQRKNKFINFLNRFKRNSK